jgi:hypothetical protein
MESDNCPKIGSAPAEIFDGQETSPAQNSTSSSFEPKNALESLPHELIKQVFAVVNQCACWSSDTTNMEATGTRQERSRSPVQD